MSSTAVREFEMSYSAEISRSNPTCFLFLLDQSRSMNEPFGPNSGTTKSQGVADAMNRLLSALVDRCAKGETVLDRYWIGVIGYGDRVGPALSGPLMKHPLLPVSEIANTPLRIEERTRKVTDGAGGIVEERVRFPVWLEARANGKTPMCQAFNLASRVMSGFLSKYPSCFPPIVINISDGEATDGEFDDVEESAQLITQATSDDGKALLFNMHVSSIGANPIRFPDSEASLPDDFAKLLFRISSMLPPSMIDAAHRDGFTVGRESRGFVFNADLVSVVQFLDIGTRVDRTARNNGQ